MVTLHRRRVVALLSLCAVLVVITCVRLTRAQSQVIAEAGKWFSEDTLLYVEVQKPESLADRLDGLGLREVLRQLPAVANALEKRQVRELRSVVDVVARSQGKSVGQLVRDLVAGGFAVAMEQPDGIAVVVTPRTAETLERARETLIGIARDDAKAKGNDPPYSTFEHGGTTVYQLGDKEAHAIVGGRLVLASRRDLVTRIIDRMTDNEKSGSSLTDNADWARRRREFRGDAGAFAFANLDGFRTLDAKFMKGKPEDEAGGLFLLGFWFDALRKATDASATLSWPEGRLEASLDLEVPADAIAEPFRRFRPADGQGAAPLLAPPGTLASFSLWRDFSAIWEVRDQILPAEALPGLAQFDTFAGQFFGGRDFGSGVLSALGSNWRVVVVQQDYDKMDPAPDTKLPGIALVLDLNPEDEQFAVRLQAAFQSFVALVNLDSAQKKNPTLLLGSETFEGVTFTKATYLAPPNREPGESYETRFNIAPCAAQVGNTFILSSSLDVTRALIRALKQGQAAKATSDATLEARADGAEIARLVELNRESLVMKNMLTSGNDKPAAESEVDFLIKLLRSAESAGLRVHDRDNGFRATLSLELDR